MFFSLPQEIIQYIYEFDNTYHEIYKQVLKEIEIFQIYIYKNEIYYIYDKEEEILYTTDSLRNPTWICSSFHIQKDYFKEIIKKKRLIRSNYKLEYDIRNYRFYDTELRFL